MIFYGSSLSPYVRKVLAFAGEKGIELELQPTGAAPGQPSEEFLEASPFRKMPAFRDGDYTLADSSAIIHYLEAKYPEPALIPSDPKLRGKTIWFEEFADTILRRCGAKIFFNRIVAPRFLGRPGDEEAAAPGRAQRLAADPRLSRADGAGRGRLSGRRPADAGRHRGRRARSRISGTPNTSVDPERYPRTVAYVDRILARPSFAPWIERETAYPGERAGIRKRRAPQGARRLRWTAAVRRNRRRRSFRRCRR